MDIAQIWQVILAFIDQATGWVQQGTNLVQAITAFVTAIIALLAALAALRGRSGPKASPRVAAPVPPGTSTNERKVKLPELKALEARQANQLYLNGIAGTWLLPIAVVLAALYLVAPALAPLSEGRLPNATTTSFGAMGLILALCWYIERRLNPDWRAKQARTRLALATKLRREVETQLAKIKGDPNNALTVAQIEKQAKEGIARIEKAESEDLPVGV